MSGVTYDPRGWALQKFTAKVDGEVVGFLKTSYIPSMVFDSRYPTVFDYLKAIEGRNFDFPGDEIEELRAMSQIVGVEWEPDVSPSYRRMLKTLFRPFLDRYMKFRDYHEDKPTVEYISAAVLRQGVGSNLYRFAAKYYTRRGMGLWSSSIQSAEAKATWSYLKQQGYHIESSPMPQGGTRLTLMVR